MGILGRVKGRVRGGLRKVRDGLKAVNDEAKYPGRPPGHQAQDHPLWRDPDLVRDDREPVAHPPAPPEPAGAPTPTEKTDRNDEPFWFLQDNEALDGWDQTNPSEEWRKRHGVEET